MTWHVEPGLLDSYSRGALPDAPAFSIESHLMTCAACRDELAMRVDTGPLAQIWSRVEETIRAPRPGLVERGLLLLGIKEHTARLLSSTPSLSLSWFLAVLLALSFAVGAAHASASGFVLFLLAAPLLPLAGVAAAYGPGVDPTYEIGLASPMRGFGLLLTRAAAVLVVTVILGTIAALALPGLDWIAIAWLLPSVALVTSCLALATVLAPLPAAASVAFVWMSVVSVSIALTSTTPALQAFFAGTMQVVVLGLILLSTSVLIARRQTFEEGIHI